VLTYSEITDVIRLDSWPKRLNLSQRATPKQQQFVAEYLIDLTATKAAIRAGYSAKTANRIGPELLTKSAVQDAVTAAQADRADRTKIDADWVLTRLAQEVDADLADLYEADGALKPTHDWPPIWRKGLVAGLDMEEGVVSPSCAR